MSKAAVLFTSVTGTILILISSFIWTPALRNNPSLFVAYTGIAFGSVLFLYAYGEGRKWYVVSSSQMVLQSMIFLLGKSLIFDSGISLHLLSLPLTVVITLILMYFEDTSKKILLKISGVLAGIYLLLVLLAGHFSFKAILSAVTEINSEYFQLIVMASLLGVFWYIISERQKDDEPELYDEEEELQEDSINSSGINNSDTERIVPGGEEEVVQGNAGTPEKPINNSEVTATESINEIAKNDEPETSVPAKPETTAEPNIPEEHLRFIPNPAVNSIKKGETPGKDISPETLNKQ